MSVSEKKRFKSNAEAHAYVVESATKNGRVRAHLESVANNPKAPALERAEAISALAEANEARAVLEGMGIREDEQTGVIPRDDGTTEFRFRAGKAGGAR